MAKSNKGSDHAASSNQTQLTAAQAQIKNLLPVDQIYVQKWVDYSSKYGLGYQMSDQTVGVYFNDNTKMIEEKEGDREINYVYSTKTKDK